MRSTLTTIAALATLMPALLLTQAPAALAESYAADAPMVTLEEQVEMEQLPGMQAPVASLSANRERQLLSRLASMNSAQRAPETRNTGITGFGPWLKSALFGTSGTPSGHRDVEAEASRP
jgi:hypothetical protein